MLEGVHLADSEADYAAVRALIEHKAAEIEDGQRELALEPEAR